jgi:hypothetical protein
MLSVDSFKKLKIEVSPDLFLHGNAFLFNFEESDIQDLTFPFDSEVYSYTEENGTKAIKEHYNIGKHKQIVEKIGFWNQTDLVLTSDSLVNRRRNLHGLEILAETMPEPPYAVFEEKERKIIGIIGDLWHGILEKSLNFTTKISTPPDNKWGSVNEDCSWSGLVGGILEKRIDIALTSLYFSFGRAQVIDFSETLTEEQSRMYIKTPEREASWSTFLHPFHKNVWGALLLLILSIIGSFYASYYIGIEKRWNTDSFTLSETPLVVLGSLIGQGSFLEPKSLSSKIVFMVSFLLGVLTISSFNATLTSYLTVFKTDLPFRSLAGLLETDYTIGAFDGADYDEFVSAPMGSVKRIISETILNKLPSTKNHKI